MRINPSLHTHMHARPRLPGAAQRFAVDLQAVLDRVLHQQVARHDQEYQENRLIAKRNKIHV